jgi:hypothetical protein
MPVQGTVLEEYPRIYLDFRGSIKIVRAVGRSVYAVGRSVYFALLSLEAFASAPYMMIYKSINSKCYIYKMSKRTLQLTTSL